jgi:hypothetical protein
MGIWCRNQFLGMADTRCCCCYGYQLDGELHRHPVHKSGSPQSRLEILPSYGFPNLLISRFRVLTLQSVFAIFCYSFFPIVFFLYPETSQRTLEDMDQIFLENPSIFVFKDKAITQMTRPEVFVLAEERRIDEGV